MYGVISGASVPIYGYIKDTNCKQTDICLTGPTLEQFLGLVMAVQNVVEKLFPQAQAQAPWVAQMSARGGIPVPYFIRLAWRKRFVGETFIGTPIQIGQLKDTYLEYQMDWRTDPYLRANIRDI